MTSTDKLMYYPPTTASTVLPAIWLYRRATVKSRIPGARRDPAHNFLQSPMRSDVFTEGMRVQHTGGDARVVVFSGC